MAVQDVVLISIVLVVASTTLLVLIRKPRNVKITLHLLKALGFSLEMKDSEEGNS